MAKKFVMLPAGIASYPHLTSADTHGKFADGKYKTKVIIDAEAAADAIAEITAVATEKGVSKLPFKVDPEDETKVIFAVKSKYKPALFAADKTDVSRMKGEIGSGSTIRVHAEVWPYDTGVSLQLKSVQIIDLVDPQSCMFDEVEGSFSAEDVEFGDTAEPESPFDEVPVNAAEI